MAKSNEVITKNILLTLISVFLFWLILTFNLRFLIWICFAPFFLAIQNTIKNKKQKFLNILILSILQGGLLTLTSFTWFSKYNFNFLLIATLLMCLHFFIISLIITLLSINKPLKILSPSIAWLISILIFSFHSFGSSWLNLAFFQPMTAPLIWIIKSQGITFLIILSNSIFAEYLQNKNKKILILLILILLIPFTSHIYSNLAEPTGEQLKVALIQGNFNQSWEYRFDNPEQLFSKYKNLSLQASKQKPDLIIWPEYAIPTDLNQNKLLYNKISNLAKQTNSYLILGTLKFINPEKNFYYDYRKDTVLIFSPIGDLIGTYDSNNPVPFDKEVISGNNSPIFKINQTSFALSLCFEEYFNMEKSNSDFLISIINNQRFDNTRGIELVSLFSRLRASENKKYLIRTSNTGKTQIINPYGKIIAKLPTNKEDILISEIYI